MHPSQVQALNMMVTQLQNTIAQCQQQLALVKNLIGQSPTQPQPQQYGSQQSGYLDPQEEQLLTREIQGDRDAMQSEWAQTLGQHMGNHFPDGRPRSIQQPQQKQPQQGFPQGPGPEYNPFR